MKAVITEVSEVDESGAIAVVYNIKDKDENLLYQDQRITGDPDLVKTHIAEKLSFFIQKKKDQKKVKVGDVINVSEN